MQYSQIFVSQVKIIIFRIPQNLFEKSDNNVTAAMYSYSVLEQICSPDVIHVWSACYYLLKLRHQ